MSRLMGGEVPYCCGGVYFPSAHFPILERLLMPHPESNSSVEYFTMLLNMVMAESSVIVCHYIWRGKKKEHVECKRVVTLGFLSEAYENLDVGKAEFVYILSTAREYVLYMQAFACVWWVRQHLCSCG